MRCLAAISKGLASSLPEDQLIHVNIDGVRASIATLQIKQTTFNENEDKFKDCVLVKVSAFSLNYRERNRILSIQQQPNKEYSVLGSEFVGDIIKIGANVTDFQVGDRVMGDGCVDLNITNPGLTSTRASAEYQVFRQHKVVKLPASMPAKISAAFSVGAQTAYSMVNRLPLKTEEHVVVTGATSNTSLFALKKLSTKPVNIHAITTSAETVAKLHAQGISNVCLINRSQPFATQFQQYLSQHDIPYIDHVVDPFMDVYMPKLLPFVRRFGYYVSCGVARQAVDAHLDAYTTEGLNIEDVFSLILRKSITLIGNNLGTRKDLAEAIKDYQEGKLHIDIDNVYSKQGDIGEFVKHSLSNTHRFGKVVFHYPAEKHAVELSPCV